MINLHFEIDSPWRGSTGKQVDYVCYDRIVANDKSLEVQISKWGQLSELFAFTLDLRWRGRDHAGPRLEITLLKFFFCIQIYDHRHWNYDANRWELSGANPWEDSELDDPVNR